MLCFVAGMVDDHGNHIGQEEHAEALGRDVLGRSGGDLMVRMVQALVVMTMQGCSGPDSGQAGIYLEAVLFYFLEVFYNNPVFFLAALLTYVLVTSRWNEPRPSRLGRSHPDREQKRRQGDRDRAPQGTQAQRNQAQQAARARRSQHLWGANP